jgi:protein gp37
MGKTKIDWADAVWNPTIGCTKVSAGCENCYAERMAARLKAMGRPEYQDVVDDEGRWTGKVTLLPERLNQPLHWLKPRWIFVDSMSDLFHTCVPFAYIKQILKVMILASQHTFIILTKRADLMLGFTKWMAGWDDISIAEWPRNVWLGVSISNEDDYWMIEKLLQTPAAVRLVSVEPMLGPIDLFEANGIIFHNAPKFTWKAGTGIDWVICGGESGPNARPMHPFWVRDLYDQCISAEVPFFFKQWGEWIPAGQKFNVCGELSINTKYHDFGDAICARVGKLKAGHLLYGQEYHQFPSEG